MEKEILPTYSIQKDFIVFQWPNSNLDFQPSTDICRLSEGAFIVGLEGSYTISVNLTKHVIEANSLLTIPPHYIIQFHDVSDNFKGYFLLFTPEFAADINLLRSSIPFMEEIHNNPLLKLTPENTTLFADYCEFLHKVKNQPLTDNSPEIRRSLLMSFLYTLVAAYKLRIPEQPKEKQSRSNVIFRNFIKLVMEHYSRERGVSFYADKLCITPKYLSTVCKDVSHKLATDIIANAVILDAKSKLQNTSLTVQEVSDSLNFPNASFFGRYFKRHTGFSPMQYRETLK